MADRDQIISFCDELLSPAAFEDFCPNGLQVPGAGDVELLITGVSAQLELFERAAEAGAQMVLCHHGIFWGSSPGPIDAALKRRLQTLFDADVSLAAYHLPLDAHPQIGNNALICSALGLEPVASLDVGFEARAPEPLPAPAFKARCADLFGQPPLSFDAGPDEISRVGVVSGGAASRLDEAIGRGLDAFVTGEPRENVMAQAREAGIHFLACGHYATETFGVRRLGELIADRFGIEARFEDIPNPV